MNIKEYIPNLTESSYQKATITLLLTETEILLAMKKRGFGIGKWNGVGGKSNQNESILNAAIRESQEEIGVTPKDPEHVATIMFYHPYKSEGRGYNQQVSVFISREWEGKPQETEEMKPQWFKQNEIPYQDMWWDDEIWFPIILRGSKVRASFMFDENDKVIDQIIEEVEIL